MLYVQLKERLIVKPGETIYVRDVADVIGSKQKDALDQPLPLQLQEGVWRIPATTVVAALLPLKEEISVLGADEIFVHATVEQSEKKHPVRSACAFLILFFGSALAISWFHADVGMGEAQRAFVRMLSGKDVANPWWMAIPYALGVAAGVGGYYAILNRKTVSPLDIKLQEYRSKAEKTAGRTP